MLQKSRGGGFVDGVVNIPEPQIGLGQRRMQRLAGRHRHQALFVRAAEKKGDPHRFVLSSFRDGPKDQTRNLVYVTAGFRVRSFHSRPGMTSIGQPRSA